LSAGGERPELAAPASVRRDIQDLVDRFARNLDVAPISAHDKLCHRRIEATDMQIDAVVYELYGLTEEEIAIVEGRDSGAT
jgi:hypothetical protein